MGPAVPGSSAHKRLKLKSKLGSIIFGTHAHHLLFRNTAVVVVFHRVDARLKGNPISCTPDEFRDYLDFFARNFNVCSLDEIARRSRNGEDLTGRLAITFDDGYLDNYEIAMPELEKRGMHATFFIASGMIGTERQPWWDVEYGSRAIWMDWDQVRSMHERGFGIGAHTVNHVDLGQVHGDDAKREIVESKERLEKELNTSIDLFSFPYGGENRITAANREIIRDAGFSCCFSAHGGVIQPGEDAFHLKRSPVTPWHVSPAHLGFEVALRR